MLWQELLTVAQVTDLLLRRKVAAALDVLVQRAKSLEATLRGGHYSVSRQLELVNAEQVRIAEPAEQVEAARSARDEFRNRSIGNRPHGMATGDPRRFRLHRHVLEALVVRSECGVAPGQRIECSGALGQEAVAS